MKFYFFHKEQSQYRQALQRRFGEFGVKRVWIELYYLWKTDGWVWIKEIGENGMKAEKPNTIWKLQVETNEMHWQKPSF